VNPFLYPDYKWDFRLPRFSRSTRRGTNTAWFRPAWLGRVQGSQVFHENLVFYVNYLGGEAATAT